MMKYDGAERRVVFIACDISANSLGELPRLILSANHRGCREGAERRAVPVVPIISANISADSPRALGST